MTALGDFCAGKQMIHTLRSSAFLPRVWPWACVGLLALLPDFALSQGAGQGDPAALEAYVRVTAAHFVMPESEVALLVEGRLPADELPVVLRVSQVSGISPTALIARRRSGESWIALGQRYGVGAGSFYEAIPEGEVDERTRRAHRLFAETPSTSWDTLQLTDDEVITLVNLHMLTREIGVDHARVLTARSSAGSFVLALRLMAG